MDDWDTAQTVTVKAGEDNDGANDTVTLTHTASGGDYVSITKDLPVSITDTDTAAIVLSETDLTVTEGDATGDRYTVTLATQPTDTVTVTISGHDAADLTLSGTTLTFTVGRLGHGADGDGQGGRGRRRRQRHRHADAHRIGAATTSASPRTCP